MTSVDVCSVLPSIINASTNLSARPELHIIGATQKNLHRRKRLASAHFGLVNSRSNDPTFHHWPQKPKDWVGIRPTFKILILESNNGVRRDLGIPTKIQLSNSDTNRSRRSELSQWVFMCVFINAPRWTIKTHDRQRLAGSNESKLEGITRSKANFRVVLSVSVLSPCANEEECAERADLPLRYVCDKSQELFCLHVPNSIRPKAKRHSDLSQH